MFFRNRSMLLDHGLFAPIVPGAIVLSLFGMTQLFSNQFGYDRHGFRALVLLPTPRRSILLAKTLAVLPVAGTVGMLFTAAAAAMGGFGVAGILGAVGLWLAGFVILSAFGNWVSILMPFRMNPGALRQANKSGGRVLLSILLAMLQLLFFSPLWLPMGIYFLGGKSTLAAGLAGLSIVALLAVAVLIYRLTLGPLADFMERRERQILDEVTRELE
jgi:hypothetical protein